MYYFVFWHKNSNTEIHRLEKRSFIGIFTLFHIFFITSSYFYLILILMSNGFFHYVAAGFLLPAASPPLEIVSAGTTPGENMKGLF
jgi:hypothetical protein